MITSTSPVIKLSTVSAWGANAKPLHKVDPLDNIPIRDSYFSSVISTHAIDIFEDHIDIPGTGMKTTPTCGEVTAWGSCSYEKMHPHVPFRNHCDRVMCPICYGGWRRKGAERMEDSIMETYRSLIGAPQKILDGSLGLSSPSDKKQKRSLTMKERRYHAREVKYMANMIRYNLCSAVLFPPPESDKKYISDNMKDTAKRFFEMYFIGSKIVPHSYVIKPDIRLKLIESVNEPPTDMQLYDMCRKDVLSLGDWRDYMRLSPHAHAVAASRRHLDTGNYFIEDGEFEGWTLKIKRNVNIEPKYNDFTSELNRLFNYLLDHCDVKYTQSGRVAKTYTSTGLFSAKTIKQTITEELQYCRCRICNNKLLKHGVTHDGEIGDLIGTPEKPVYVTYTAKFREYTLKRIPVLIKYNCPLWLSNPNWRLPKSSAIVDPPDPIW